MFLQQLWSLAWAGTVEIGGKHLTAWSFVQPALKLQTIKVLQDKWGMDASDAGANILAVLKEDESSRDSQTNCDNTEDPTIMFQTLERTNQDSGFYDDLKQFNDSWGGLAQLERHPLFNDMMAQIWRDANHQGTVITHDDVFDMYSKSDMDTISQAITNDASASATEVWEVVWRTAFQTRSMRALQYVSGDGEGGQE